MQASADSDDTVIVNGVGASGGTVDASGVTVGASGGTVSGGTAAALNRYWTDKVHFKPNPGQNSNDCIKALYDDLAEKYEEISGISGYKAYDQCPEILDRTLERMYGDAKKSLKILDAGAGTGMVGLNLKNKGYTNIDALDISQEMLNKAKEKNVYQKLICAALCEDPIQEIDTGTYDAIIAVAAITAGHIKPLALEELVRHAKPGGIICFTLRQDIYETGGGGTWGYKTTMDDIARKGKWESVSKDLIDYYSDVDETRKKCYAVVYKVIKNQ